MAPLRDRPPTNSPDPEWPPQPTTPLRIAKRDTPQRQHASQVSRRSSSTYSKLKTSSLVSQSPFRAQGPPPIRPSSVVNGPSPRRVSGEKRPRPNSMQGENERPIGYKRRQSKGFQGLAEREPVTKSPFRHGVSSEDEPPPVPPKTSLPISRLPTPSSSGSPARSSLVSKRFHGPRILGSELPKRQRRKTVTFDERCDVVEFERDDSGDFDEDPFASTDEEDPYDVHQRYESPLMHGGDDSGDGPDAITGLVDSMLQETQDEPGMHTPPQEHRSLPPDVDNEDGVPYGRTHHAERVHANQHPTPPTEDSDPPQLANTSLDFHDVTPPRNRKSLGDVASLEPGSHLPLGRSTHSERMKRDHMPAEIDEDVKMLPPSPSPTKIKPANHNVHLNRESLIPKFDLGVHSEGNQKADHDAPDPFVTNIKDEDIQVVELSFMSGSGSSQGDDMDPANLSIAHSEVSLSGFAAELGLNELTKDGPLRTSTPPFSTPPLRTSLSHRRSAGLGENVPSPISRSRSASPLTAASPRVEREPTSHSGSPIPGRAISPAVASPLGVPARVTSPFQLQRALGLGEPSSSSSSLGSAGGGVRRPAINRDEMQRRVMTRSHNSPGPWTEGNRPEMPPSPATTESANTSFANGPAQEEQVLRSADRAPLRREDNATYDGIMSIDPEPQDIDPPRPAVLARSRSDGDVDEEDKEAPVPSTFEAINLDLTSSKMHLGSMDFGSGGLDIEDVEMRSAVDRLVEDVASSTSSKGSKRTAGLEPELRVKGSHGTLRIEEVTQGVQARQFEPPSDQRMSDIEEARPSQEDLRRQSATPPLLSGTGFTSPSVSRNSSGSSIPPPPPPKDAIRTREQIIMEKRRELRRKEEQGDEELEIPVGRRGRIEPGGARVNRRRSRSTGDADGLARGLTPRDGKTMRTDGLLDMAPFESEEDPLADSIARELRRLGGASQARYHVREREGTIYASADVETVSHMKGAGDVDTGKAWRTVRRPSDMNEHAKRIREYRAQEKPGKAYGKVFVKVIGVKGLNVPIPQQPTALTCTLNNGIHFVTTPECRLARDCRIDQEFELIEHSKLEFTLTLKIKRDPHIVAQFKANAPQPPPPVKAVPQQPASKGGMRGLFSSKKPAPAPIPSSPARPQLQIQENLARYLKQDGTLARCFVSFKDIVTRCDTTLFQTEFKLMGQRLDNKGKMESQEVGELVLQMFRLPPLGGIPPNQLPQSLDECWTGLRHARWHKMTYFEGTLTQNGGDCTTWRRRRFRIIGANMVAFNDVTKKATATIDLRKAVSVDDVPDGRSRTFSPISPSTTQSRSDEYDGLYGVERSFRLIFSKDQEIVFFADTDEEKKRWLEVLNIMVGHIPPNPLWAELLRQRQQDLEKQGLARQAAAPRSAVPSSPSTQNLVRT